MIPRSRIWLSVEYPFIAGSPIQSVVWRPATPRLVGDGVVYETLEVFELPDGVLYYRCRRALLEIKTPFKLRNRQIGGSFYPESTQGNGRVNHIPPAYYDQVQGNCWLLGLETIYFLVLTPSGFQVSVDTYDPTYTTQSLVPSLVNFWRDVVIPAFRERDRIGHENVSVGWLPNLHSLGPAAGDAAPPAKRPRLDDGRVAFQ